MLAIHLVLFVLFHHLVHPHHCRGLEGLFVLLLILLRSPIFHPFLLLVASIFLLLLVLYSVLGCLVRPLLCLLFFLVLIVMGSLLLGLQRLLYPHMLYLCPLFDILCFPVGSNGYCSSQGELLLFSMLLEIILRLFLWLCCSLWCPSRKFFRIVFLQTTLPSGIPPRC